MRQLAMIEQPVFDIQKQEQTLAHLPALEETFAAWFTAGRPEAAHALTLREQLLGAATLPAAGLSLIYEVVTRQLEAIQSMNHLSAWYKRPVHQRLVRHAATISASEKQAVLPQGVLVQKTVSVEMAGRLLLCSRIGDQKLARQQMRAIQAALSLPRWAATHTTINPPSYEPTVEFGIQVGMVSPFLPPLRPMRVAALVLLPWPMVWEDQEREVAISLSLWESLLLPLHYLKPILARYASQAYPHLPVIELSGEEHTNNA
jgi:hypothetical protein